MTEAEAGAVAQKFLDASIETHQGSLFRGLKVVSVRPDPLEPRRWVALFSSVNADGACIDGGPIIIVNDDTGEPRFWEHG